MKIFINKETGKYFGEGSDEVFMENCFFLENISPEDLEKLKNNGIYFKGKIFTEEDLEKYKKIENFKNKKSLAEKLRLEYITTELLPEGENRTKILASLEEKKQTLASKMDLMITEFISEYGEDILEILI